MMKPTWIIGILGIIAVAVLIVAAMALGMIPGLNIAGIGQDTPPDSEYCGFTDAQILDMIEVLSGKDLNNEVGIGFVRSMNMKACGTDTKTPLEISTYYKGFYIEPDWYILNDNHDTGAGWEAYTLVLTNHQDPTQATWVRAILTGGGTAVKEFYDYDTITIVSDGTTVTYIAMAAWLDAS